jgi:hypothetical protein
VSGSATAERDFSVFHGAGPGTDPVLMTTANTVFGPTPPLGNNFDNNDAGFINLFPSKTVPGYTTAAGSPGLGWVSGEVRQENNLITCLLNGVAIAQYTNTYGYTNGMILIGYNDVFASLGSTNNFVIFDNVSVTPIVYAPVNIVTPQLSGTSFGFSFGTEAYESYTVQWTTNLLSGSWVNYTNFMGTGSPMTLSIPLPVGSDGQYFRVTRP